MTKGNSDGDVLVNRLNVALAKQRRLLNSMLGAEQEADLQDKKTAQQDEAEDAYRDPGL